MDLGTPNSVVWHARPVVTTSDGALIDQIEKRDQGAMRVLYARYHLRVYRFVLRLVKDAATAEDITSEVFFQAWEQAARFEARSSVSTWLLAIARNKALSEFRRRSSEQLDEESASSLEDPQDGPELALQKRERTALIRTCIARLSPEHQEIIDLVYYHGKSVADAATIVRVSPNTIKTRMFHARKQLAAQIGAFDQARIKHSVIRISRAR
jgi:RNA polymerase sigma-70 factor, ECF subfamily